MTELPGPGNYDADLNLIGKNGPSVSIGAKKPRNDETIGPGPGGYKNSDNISPVRGNLPSYRMGSTERKTHIGGITHDQTDPEGEPTPGFYYP